jgi:uncharacterized membrane protein
MNVRYRHGLITGFFGGWSFGTITTGYWGVTVILLVIVGTLVFFDRRRGLMSDPAERQRRASAPPR